MNIPKVIAITGGKGGVGKTTVAVNLAICLSRLGEDVILLDADLGLANVDILLGLNCNYNLSNVLEGTCSLEEVVVDGPEGVKIIPGGSGIIKMADAGSTDVASIINLISDYKPYPETIIIDTAAGISKSVLGLCSASDEVVVVLTNEPTSIADAYGLIKVLNTSYGVKRFNIVTSMLKTQDDSDCGFAKLIKVTNKFLDVSLRLIGQIPFDTCLVKAVKRRKAVSDVYPSSKASVAFDVVACELHKMAAPKELTGKLQFYADKITTRQGVA